MSESFLFGHIDDKLPSRCIIIWSGAVNEIPTGWVLCDGNNSTPNLKDRFVVCAGGTYTVGNTGGSTTQSVAAHTHSGAGYSGGYWSGWVATSGSSSSVRTSHGHYLNISASSGGAHTVDTTPSYYSLCYIMKS